MDWFGWAVFGMAATVLLTTVLVLVQLLRHTRLDLPLMLGSTFVEDWDRARIAGFVAHLVFGQLFAFFYAAGFSALGESGAALGGFFGLLHALIALTVLVPLLPTVNPRMSSERSGPSSVAVLEPPGPLALSYGPATPIITIIGHIAYGIVLGLTLQPS